MGGTKGVIKLMDNHTIIKLNKEGYSNRNISKMFPINRKTVTKYWNEYVEQQTLLEVAQPYDVTNILEKISTSLSLRKSVMV
ncbi:hypothetical protein GC105_01730 [Alkalibaculum sp. M08DMB]|uniref:Uncharacterized protein n=1 Tax=Alkalibaculum sporogenes TaxID=2655001 RepID=A0A6A7K5U4_9FIRM|nr:hypothetical protein [Alkalibaculum sporogenes]MPW24513.1 hypothetical protein [Alkalibaculum sporogenes]